MHIYQTFGPMLGQSELNEIKHLLQTTSVKVEGRYGDYRVIARERIANSTHRVTLQVANGGEHFTVALEVQE